MRIITRGDFDGLACTVLLREILAIEGIHFVHPKDVQDGKVQATPNDIVVNLPYIPGCGLWFDHHISEQKNLPPSFCGRFEIAPSCARVVYHHYAQEFGEQLGFYLDLIEAADKIDSAKLSVEDIRNPQGWVLLALTLDPRSGVGGEYQRYFLHLADLIQTHPIDHVLQDPEVKKVTDRLRQEQEEFVALLRAHTRIEGKVIVTDFRGIPVKPAGNRFLIYTLFPKALYEIRMVDGPAGVTVFAVGASIFNWERKVNIGELLQQYGGGGHVGAGTAQVPSEKAETVLAEILATLHARS